jgi:hypothetical protein
VSRLLSLFTGRAAQARTLIWGARASRVESAAVVVARRGKNASARSSSVRRRAIPDARALAAFSSVGIRPGIPPSSALRVDAARRPCDDRHAPERRQPQRNLGDTTLMPPWS